MRYSRRHLVQGAGAVGLGLLAGCGRWPGQTPRGHPRVGYLSSSPPDITNRLLDTFRRGLAEQGLIDGEHVTIEARGTPGQVAGLTTLATELVQLPVDVILASGERATRAARDATNILPIVMVTTADPTEAGFVASLSHPGGNVTGQAGLGRQLVGKRMELLRDAIPGLTRVGVLWNGANPVAASNYAAAEAAAASLGLRLQPLDVRATDGFEGAFKAALDGRNGAILVLEDPLMTAPGVRIVDLAAAAGLPAMYPIRTFMLMGGLMSYGANVGNQHYRAATHVAKILRGSRPADLPVEQPREFDFIINLKTAQALGLTIPPHVLLQATEVIQ
jgi:putative tryptophan/tyrosine transport system substrate-binding protein